MKKIRIGIVDYGIGNYASLTTSLTELGYIVYLSHNKKKLSEVDVILLPGVGAFPEAMKAIKKYNLDQFLKRHAQDNKPVIGICLGMQLLADASSEVSETRGLGIIPGKVIEIKKNIWHVGWNNIEVCNPRKLNKNIENNFFYFNHSYIYEGNKKYVYATTKYEKKFASIIGINRVIGIQFHPEKSQIQGKLFFNKIIKNLLYA
jgi:glutamine amidotransferase